jgi:hypothetical protein
VSTFVYRSLSRIQHRHFHGPARGLFTWPALDVEYLPMGPVSRS